MLGGGGGAKCLATAVRAQNFCAIPEKGRSAGGGGGEGGTPRYYGQTAELTRGGGGGGGRKKKKKKIMPPLMITAIQWQVTIDGRFMTQGHK